MAISIDFNTQIINVPKTFMVQISASLYELDVNLLRLALKDIEDDVGMTYPDTHRHNTEIILAGVTYARSVEIINGYTVTFEDGQYVVRCVGANHNLSDVKNLNQVSLIVGNAAGLVVINGGGGVGTVEQVANAVWNAPINNYTASGSTGAKLSIVPDTSAIATAVRNEISAELAHILTIQNNPGLTNTQATMLLEMYELLGLDPAKPLLVTSTTRTAGTISQTIATDSSHTIVTRV